MNLFLNSKKRLSNNKRAGYGINLETDKTLLKLNNKFTGQRQ